MHVHCARRHVVPRIAATRLIEEIAFTSGKVLRGMPSASTMLRWSGAAVRDDVNTPSVRKYVGARLQVRSESGP